MRLWTKTLLILLTVLNSFFSGCNEERKEENVVKEYDKEGNLLRSYSISKDSLISGEEKFYYPNGQVKKLTYKKNGLREGRVIDYAPQGKIYSIFTYKNDSLNGPFSIYYENGVLKDTGTRFFNIYRGIRKTYYENGQLNHYVIYNDKGDHLFRRRYNSRGDLLSGEGSPLVNIENNKINFQKGDSLHVDFVIADAPGLKSKLYVASSFTDSTEVSNLKKVILSSEFHRISKKIDFKGEKKWYGYLAFSQAKQNLKDTIRFQLPIKSE